MRANSLTELDLKGKDVGVEGGMVVAGLIPVMGGLMALDLSSNDLKDEGVSAVCEAILSNKETKLESLNMGANSIGPVGAKSVAAMAAVTGGLTVIDLLYNKLDAEAAKMLAEVAKQKGVSLCGIRRDQTTADFSKQSLNLPDVILLASDLSQAVVTGGLTALNLSSNSLKDEGVNAVCEAIQSNKETKLASLNFSYNSIGPVGANAVAAMVAVTGALTKLSLAQNFLKEAGTKAICEALEQNTTLKELDISGGDHGSNTGGSAGAKHVAKMVRVNGGLTALNLSYNRLQDEGVSAVCEAIQSNKETKLASLNFGDNGIGPVGANAVAAMVAVTGGLTSIDLSRNGLCGIWTNGYDQQGTYTAEGITAIADALRVNGGLTSLDLSYNMLCGVTTFGHGTYTAEGITSIAEALRVNGALTKLSLASNNLMEEGTKAICEALEQNRTLKELDISGGEYHDNIGGSAGAKHVAKMLGVNGALTVTNLLGNCFDAESAKVLAEVAKQKGISLCGIRRDQSTADFSKQNLKPRDAILLASDLSQAVVTGALTKIELSRNFIGEEGKALIREALQGKAGFELLF